MQSSEGLGDGSWGAGWQQHPKGGQDAAGSPIFGGTRVRLYVWVCACPHTCTSGQARECVTAIWGRPQGPARAERASPGCCHGRPAAAAAGEITSR